MAVIIVAAQPADLGPLLIVCAYVPMTTDMPVWLGHGWDRIAHTTELPPCESVLICAVDAGAGTSGATGAGGPSRSASSSGELLHLACPLAWVCFATM